jgi:hypothetical protein
MGSIGLLALATQESFPSFPFGYFLHTGLGLILMNLNLSLHLLFFFKRAVTMNLNEETLVIVIEIK